MIRYSLILLLAAVAPLGAQNASAEGGRDTADAGDVPADHRPPPGMCRIWIDNVPAARQPAPTDCSTAIRRRPPNARVVFGKQLREPDQGIVRLPQALPLVDERRNPANAERVPDTQRGSETPRPEEQRARDTSPPQRPVPAQVRPRGDRPRPQTRERRAEPRVAAPRRVDPPRARSTSPAPTQRRPQIQHRKP